MNNRGQQFELLALAYLEQQGLRLIEQNYLCKMGEIDLIMQHDKHLVFIEVKYRASNAYGGAAAAVTPAKQKKLTRTAKWYLQQHKLNNVACRFDVVAIEGHEPYQYQWLRNAIN
ncbi:YraN family protein [Rheinheimera sp. WS51]|uniref:YraN family protein n=1 Tax=Rheinheimera sp. WS51 TaxID=3425886 RepID=UPI003D939D5E